MWNFLMGIAFEWFYAAVRPGFGPGPKAAVYAGLAVWFVVWFLGFGGTLLAGMIPTNGVVLTLLWGLSQVLIATVGGISIPLYDGRGDLLDQHIFRGGSETRALMQRCVPDPPLYCLSPP